MTAGRTVALLGVATIVTTMIIGGWWGLAYVAGFILATTPGWPVGAALFGSAHPARWIAGSLIGYGLTAVALWVPLAAHEAGWLTFVIAWVSMTALAFLLCRRADAPLLPPPEWTASTTRALALVLLLVPALMVLPYRHVGQVDEEGGRRYRAYFTADFVWHEALTAELARFEFPPRNPYMAAEPLHYYWGYFILPSSVSGVVAQSRVTPPIETFLAINALGAGLLFLGAVFLAGIAAVPRPGAVAAAIALLLLAASAEGLYEVIALARRGLPLAQAKGINIDAVTAWFFYGLTIDGLPRSLWWGPQHATASALGLVALTAAARAGREMSLGGAIGSGLALGLALLMSPFPAGMMTVIYGLAILWGAVALPRMLPRIVTVQSAAVVMVALGLAWCLYNETFEGAGGAVEFGLSRAATRDPFTILGLALGPVLVPTLAGFALVGWRRFPSALRPSVVGVTLAGVLFFCVTLVLEPIWVGWRAGHQFMVCAPALLATALAAVYDRFGRAVAAAVTTVVLLIGLPTTVIDLYNAQDTSNLNMGPGFRWTVRLSAQEREALDWIQRRTPRDATVQMSLEPRGRETWSLIPSFAHRRMAAGLPISLLRTPEYEALAARADRIYATEDPAEAAALARELKIDYIYVGRVEREAFPTGVAKFTSRPEVFGRVFSNEDAAIFLLY